jgi:hypothetical protein
MPSLVLIVKILVTIAMVLALSVAAERLSPRVAGLLSGYPLGGAIALFFMGLEISPGFAAESAVHTPVGLMASQVFVYCYYRASIALRRWVVAGSSAAALAGFFAAAWLLDLIPFSRTAAILVPIGSIFLFTALFRRLPNVAIARRLRLTLPVLLARAALAALIIVAVTGTAKTVGPARAGLFSAFPTALFPLMLIVHLTYDRSHVHTIIKNFPLGLGSLIAYAMAVSLLYPCWGIGLGTAAGFGVATLYLVAFGVVVRRLARGRGAP